MNDRPRVFYHVSYEVLKNKVPYMHASCTITCLQIRDVDDFQALKTYLGREWKAHPDEVSINSLSVLYTHPTPSQETADEKMPT